MLRLSLFLLCALGASMFVSVHAAAPAAVTAAQASPYSATVPVAGTSDAQRNAAISAAFKQVLQQVSPGFSAGTGVLANASGYVRNFRYRRGAGGKGLELQVDFDPGAVGRAVKQGGGTSRVAASAPAATAAVATAAPVASGAPTAAAAGSGRIWVGGIDDTHAYAALLAMLRGDSELQNVVPVGAAHDGILLQASSSQPLAAVLSGLETPGGHLEPAAQPHAGADASLSWSP